jgi:hypothetical protein
MSIDRFRNSAARIALDGDMDYVMFIDDDMQFEYTIFQKLLDTRYDIIGALNYIRGYPFDPMAFKYGATQSKKDVKHLEHLSDKEIDDANSIAGGKVLKCDAIGTAVCLINVKTTIKRMGPPWFLTGPHNTEDIYFCIKAKQYNPKVKIGIHSGAITGHRLDPEVISYNTRKHLQAYYESYMTKEQIESARGTGDRAEGYIENNIEPGLLPDSEDEGIKENNENS